LRQFFIAELAGIAAHAAAPGAFDNGRDLIARHVGKEALELEAGPGQCESLLEGSAELVRARQTLGDDLIIYTDHGRELAGRVSARAADLGFTLNYRRVRPTNLEDVFLKLTGESLMEDQGKDREGYR
jgi:lipooligosaccharide transport system ATP-binding protein